MVTTIAHRELRNNSSDVLRRAQSGELFEITNHGQVVAQLGPVGSGSRNRVTGRERSEGSRFSSLKPVKLDHPIQETLDDLRGDR